VYFHALNVQKRINKNSLASLAIVSRPP